MLSLTEAFSHLKPIKVLVIGDFLFDVYTIGKVDRISPEAPVPVLLVSEVTKAPGGAGNVALNLEALGAEVSVAGRIGLDESSESLRKALSQKGIDTEGLFIQEEFSTPLKNRFLADGQQLIRADYEKIIPLSKDVEDVVEAYVKNAISQVDIVAVSDYGKGFLTNRLLTSILKTGKNEGVRVIVDPKGSDFSKYSGAYLIKPNNKEAYAAAGVEHGVQIEEVAQRIFEKVDAEHILITRSDKGMALFDKGKKEAIHFPAVKKDVLDVTGAGDTALAMITFALANQVAFNHAITLANIASGLAIERVGCQAIRLSEIALRLLEKEPSSKIFWEGTNLFVLERAIDDTPVMIINLNGHEDISSSTYHLIKELADKKMDAKLIAHIAPTDENINFIHLLASMHEIDFVYARADSPEAFLTTATLTTI